MVMKEKDLKYWKKQFEICTKASKQIHEGQIRTRGVDKGKPYFIHPERVAKKAIKKGLGYFRACIAVLHDGIEDYFNHKEKDAIGFMREWGIDEDVILQVKVLTRKPKENYFDFIHRIVMDYDNLPAMEVKYLDILDNMETLEEGSLKDKYRFALDVVIANIDSCHECMAIMKGVVS